MKVLATAISAAATAQSLEDRGSVTAWTSIYGAYNSLYDAILTAYSNTNIPGVKKANRLRDFLNKVDNFPTRVSDSCANFAGSGDPNAFVFPNYDENDICHSLNNLISSVMSFHDAFVCMDGVNLTTHNGWAPHKMRRLIHRQRHILFTRKFKQLKCNLPIAPTPAPCESDPCDGLESCETFVNGCSLFPVRNNLVSTVQTALDYKFSAEVLCNSLPDGNWLNIFHVSRNGGDIASVGDRTFGLWQNPEGGLHLTVMDPTGAGYQRADDFPCSNGEWATYSVEVRQISGSGNVEYVSKIGDAPLHTSQYSAGALPAGLPLQVHIADDHYDAATSYSVRNFYYQTFDPCPTRTDPCTDLDSCTTVVDSCEFNPVVYTKNTVVSAARNYKVSADVFCTDVNEWHYIVHLTSDADPYAPTYNPGNRQFSIVSSPDTGSMEISLHVDVTANISRRQRFFQPCTVGEWNTYSLEVNQVDSDPSTLRWIFSFDGTQVQEGTFALSGAYSTGDLNAFVFDNLPNSVRNFYYQTFDDI